MIASAATGNDFLTIVVGFLEIHINNATRPDSVHVRSIESLNFGESTGLHLVAAIFGEEDGDVVVFKFLGANIETGFLKAGITTPRINVISPEINGVFTVTAVEIVGQVFANFGIIIGGIAHSNGSVVSLLDVCLHVSNCSLDKGAGIGVGGIVGHLVTGKETQDVCVIGHGIDDLGVAEIQVIVPGRAVSNDGLARGRQISNHVDASICQHLHAWVVVCGRVDGIDTDGVGAQLSEERNVSRAFVGIGQGVDKIVCAITRRGSAAISCKLLFPKGLVMDQGVARFISSP